MTSDATPPVVKPNLTTARRIAITQQVTEARAFPSRMTVVLGVVMAAAADELLTELRCVEAERDDAVKHWGSLLDQRTALIIERDELQRQVEAARTALLHAQCSWAVWHQDCPIPKALAALAPQTGEVGS